MIELGPFVVEWLVAAFAGGLIGASLGALPSFTIAGVVIVVGEAATIVGRSVASASEAVDPSLPIVATGLTGSIGLGPLLGPHVAFAGGIAAAAFAAQQGYLDGAGDYHPAKAIDHSLGARPDVLLVGGAFGVLGYAVATISGSVLQLPLDPIALAIVVSGFVHRLAFGYPLVGTPSAGWLNMQPYFDGEHRPDSDRPAVEPFLPYQSEWLHNLVLGAGVGCFGAYIAYRTGSPFLAFGLSITTFVFVIIDAGDPPVTLHMALPSSIAALSLVPAEYALSEMTPALIQSVVSFPAALAIGAVFGALAGVLGEFFARTCYAHGDTHLDPPAAAIVATTLLIGVLVAVGILPNNVVLPMPV
jgi:MFS family permease